MSEESLHGRLREYRAAGSKGAIDLVAISSEQFLLIQAKKELRKTNYDKDILRLQEVVAPPDAVKQLWIKQKGNIKIITLLNSTLEAHNYTLRDLKLAINQFREAQCD